MKINLPEMTLQQARDVEKLLYVKSYTVFEFTDHDFTDFINNQFEFGFDDIEFEWDDEYKTLQYHVDSDRDQIYFFENKIKDEIESRKQDDIAQRAFSITGGVL